MSSIRLNTVDLVLGDNDLLLKSFSFIEKRRHTQEQSKLGYIRLTSEKENTHIYRCNTHRGLAKR